MLNNIRIIEVKDDLFFTSFFVNKCRKKHTEIKKNNEKLRKKA